MGRIHQRGMARDERNFAERNQTMWDHAMRQDSQRS